MIRSAFMPLICFALLLATSVRSSDAIDYRFSWALPVPQGNALDGSAYESASIGYAVGARGTVLRTTDGGISWTPRDLFPGFSTDLEDVLVLSPGVLLAVGAPPGIFRSTDAGASWTPVSNPSTGPLNDIETISGPILSAVGTNGQVLRSTDGGATWTMLPSPGARDLNEQVWLDPSDGYVLGLQLARRTTDGGQTWSLPNGITESGSFNEGFFTDALHGTILSDFEIWQTTNGGGSWTGHTPPSDFVYLGNAVVLSPSHWFVVTNLEGAAIFETTDNGATWTNRLRAGGGGFRDIDRLVDGTMIAVSDEGDAYRSTDNGLTWGNSTYAAFGPPRGTIGAVAIGQGGLGAAGTNGAPPTYWYRTTNGGSSWIPDPSGPNIAFTSEIEYWDADHAVAAGDYGKMWRTEDGGATWSSVLLPNPPTNGTSWHVSTPGPGIAFVPVTGQTQAKIYRTTDYGATWEIRSTGIPLTGGLTSVSFLNGDVGFAAGYSVSAARMYKTTDGGASWSAIGVSGLPAFPWDIHWWNEQTGLASIYLTPGGIFRTTDGGGSWTNVWAAPARDLAFSDDLHGGASAGDFFSAGSIVVTEDAGVTWSSLELPSTTAGVALTAVADGFWVGGGNSVIMKVTRTNPAAVDGSEPAEGPSGIVLRTRGLPGGPVRVEYGLPADGWAELSVIDPQGRRVTTLDRGLRAGGRPLVQTWNGRDEYGRPAPNGVYFVRLQTSREARAAKVILAR